VSETRELEAGVEQGIGHFNYPPCPQCGQRIPMRRVGVCRECYGETHRMCERCCWKDRCDDSSHRYRPECRDCKGAGWFCLGESLASCCQRAAVPAPPEPGA
jgi:hypothetical protein